jgi:Zn-dependent protease
VLHQFQPVQEDAMFGQKFTLFTLSGFRINLDLSWFFLAVLLVWSLSTGYFPSVLEGQSRAIYVTMAVIGALGLFASVVAHEFAHAVVARRYGLPISDITLFIFGGVAELKGEPKEPRHEFFVAIAGPIASLGIGVALLLIYLLMPAGAGGNALKVIIGYVAVINLLLGIFNLLPGFPLDGGRILRALLWWRSGNLHRSTQIAAAAGVGVGMLLMLLGLYSIMVGNFVSGLWQIMIGFFIQGLSRSAAQQSDVERTLAGYAVRDIMIPNPVVVPGETALSAFVKYYLYRHHHTFFPVSVDGEIRGCIRMQDVLDVPEDAWKKTLVADVMQPVGHPNAISSDDSVLAAWRRMQGEDSGKLIVMEDGRLAGLITRSDVMDFIAIRAGIESKRNGRAARPGVSIREKSV